MAPSSDLRYPIGRPALADALDASQRAEVITGIAALPSQLEAAVSSLTEAQLDTPYRPEGWTVRQVVHHVADSHLNAYIRFKLALTEETPTIKPYDEKAWAELADSRLPVSVSLSLVNLIHERWVAVLRNTGEVSYARTLRHPENGTMTIDRLLGLYSWHGRHHVAHIAGLRQRSGW